MPHSLPMLLATPLAVCGTSTGDAGPSEILLGMPVPLTGDSAAIGAMALPIVLVLVMVASGLLGAGVERLAYRPLRSAPRLTVLITAVGLSFSLEYGVRLRSQAGRAMRAIAADPKAAHLVGVDVNRVITQTFFLGSMLAGAAGVMAGGSQGCPAAQVILDTYAAQITLRK